MNFTKLDTSSFKSQERKKHQTNCFLPFCVFVEALIGNKLLADDLCVSALATPLKLTYINKQNKELEERKQWNETMLSSRIKLPQVIREIGLQQIMQRLFDRRQSGEK